MVISQSNFEQCTCALAVSTLCSACARSSPPRGTPARRTSCYFLALSRTCTQVPNEHQNLQRKIIQSVPKEHSLTPSAKNNESQYLPILRIDMSVQRSPLKSTQHPIGGSLTDLSDIDLESKNIALRKRRKPENDCTCKQEVQGLRQDFNSIKELLEKFIDKHDINMENMRQNLDDIKDQMQEIKQATTSLTLEQGNMKAEITTLSDKVSIGEAKMQNIESNVNQMSHKLEATEVKLKTLETDFFNNQPAPSASTITNEKLITEIQERNSRMKNLIISGIPETYNMDANHRRQSDQQEITRVLNILINNCPQPIKIFRIGKYTKEKNRHIKICFSTSETPILLLKNKAKLPENLKIFSDKTPLQQELFKQTMEQLNCRLAAGETNLTLKYIRGIPKIIENRPTKN